MKRGVIMICMFGVMFASCNKKNDAFINKTSHQNNRTVQLLSTESDNYSDDDVFKSVMFLDGPLTQYIGDYQKFNYRNFTNDSTEIASEATYETNIINMINELDPNYMRKFRENVMSGNYDSVFNRIESTSQLIWKLTCTLTNSTDTQLSEMANPIIVSFNQTTGYNSQDTSQEDIFNAISIFDNSDNAPKNFYYKWKWVYVHTAVAVAFVIGAVLFLPIPAGVINGGQAYLDEDYCSTVTIDLANQ